MYLQIVTSTESVSGDERGLDRLTLTTLTYVSKRKTLDLLTITSKSNRRHVLLYSLIIGMPWCWCWDRGAKTITVLLDKEYQQRLGRIRLLLGTNGMPVTSSDAVRAALDALLGVLSAVELAHNVQSKAK